MELLLDVDLDVSTVFTASLQQEMRLTDSHYYYYYHYQYRCYYYYFYYYSVHEILQSLAIQMKAVEEYFPVALCIMLYKVILTC